MKMPKPAEFSVYLSATVAATCATAATAASAGVLPGASVSTLWIATTCLCFATFLAACVYDMAKGAYAEKEIP